MGCVREETWSSVAAIGDVHVSNVFVWPVVVDEASDDLSDGKGVKEVVNGYIGGSVSL